MSEADMDRIAKKAAREAFNLAAEDFDARWAVYFENQDAYIDGKLEPLTQLAADVEEIKIDMKLIKAALRDTNRRVQNHEQRITKLEQPA